MAKEQPRLESVPNADMKPTVVTPLTMAGLQMHDQANMRWRGILPPGMPLEAEILEHPQLYSVVANRLRPFDIVEFPVEGGWGEVIILSTEKGFPVIAKVLRIVEFAAMPRNVHSDLPAGYHIAYDMVSNTYQPVRSNDGAPMAAPQTTRELARQRLVEHAIFRK